MPDQSETVGGNQGNMWPWGDGAAPAYPPPPEWYAPPATTRPLASGASDAPAPVMPPDPSAPWPAAYPPAATVPPNPYTTGAPGAVGTPRYPEFAPGGTVDPARMRQTEPGNRGRPAAGAARAGTAVGAGAGLVALLTKAAFLLKFALPLFSAVASFGVYAVIFGWQFGLGIVLLLLVHEMGHVVVIRAKGLPASLPIFVPLLGAAVFMKRLPQRVSDEAEIAIGGPLAGALAGAVCYAAFFATDSRLWLVLAYFSFLINLFNLIPVSPLDGGRVVGAISKWIWPLGLVALGVLFWYTQSLILLIVGWFGLMQTISRFRGGPALDRYYQVPLLTRLWITAVYFGLAAVLALAILQIQPLLATAGGSSPFGL
jgi:Zn-dependent protease